MTRDERARQGRQGTRRGQPRVRPKSTRRRRQQASVGQIRAGVGAAAARRLPRQDGRLRTRLKKDPSTPTAFHRPRRE